MYQKRIFNLLSLHLLHKTHLFPLRWDEFEIKEKICDEFVSSKGRQRGRERKWQFFLWIVSRSRRRSGSGLTDTHSQQQQQQQQQQPQHYTTTMLRGPHHSMVLDSDVKEKIDVEPHYLHPAVAGQEISYHDNVLVDKDKKKDFWGEKRRDERAAAWFRDGRRVA